MYAYIKEDRLVLISDNLIPKYQELKMGTRPCTRSSIIWKTRSKIDPETKNEIIDPETGLVVTEEYKEEITEYFEEEYIAQPFVDGLVYDEAIEYEIPGRVVFEDGLIISWEESKEKKEEDERLKAEQNRQRIEAQKQRPNEILRELGELANKKTGMELVGISTKDVEERIKSLKSEYESLTKQ